MEKFKKALRWFYLLPKYKQDYVESIIAMILHFSIFYLGGVFVWAGFIITMFIIQTGFVLFKTFNILNKIRGK